MSDLDRLFYWHGIAPDYMNFKGEHVQVSLENRKGLLETMGVDLSSGSEIRRAAYLLDVAPWEYWLAPLMVAEECNPSVGVNLHPKSLPNTFKWTLKDGAGDCIASGEYAPLNEEELGDYEYQGVRYSRRKLPLPSLAPDYYCLSLSSGERAESAEIAITPAACYRPKWLTSGSNCSGVIIQLYTLRSNRNWGVGDFADLRGLIEFLADRGMDAIGLNPLHALLPELEEHCSPYSPSDRRHIEPLYIDLESVKEYQLLSSGRFSAELSVLLTNVAALRDSAHVEYLNVKAIKTRVLREMFLLFSEYELGGATDRAADFKAFVGSNGAGLERFALFDAMKSDLRSFEDIVEVMGAPSGSRCYLEAVDHYSEHLEFVFYQQWLAQMQLDACQALAVSKGMSLGLIRDLAVGADRGGAEVLSNQDLFCAKAAAGAPPDAFSAIGQNWGLPPMDPASLRRSGFSHFKELLRANMKSCGALRIDHAMGLMRLWWCPPGKTADYGAYIYYPFEELIALLKLESVINQCVVIGEDLGIVPHNFRETMSSAGVVSNKVFYFERNGPTEFKPPNHYEPLALAMVNNHDVPTLASWWNGSDIKLREELDMLGEDADLKGIYEERLSEKQNLVGQLIYSNLLPDAWIEKDLNSKADQSLIFSIMQWMGSVSSKLYVVQLEDLMMMEAPVNVPGTYKEYPNWRRKLSLGVEALAKDDAVCELLDQISQQRKQ